MQGATSSACLDLAQLHSDAVDFPKTGRKVELPQRLKPRRYPDFMQNKHKCCSSAPVFVCLTTMSSHVLEILMSFQDAAAPQAQALT